MKLPTLLLAGSLLANAALVALFISQPVLAPPAVRGFFSSAPAPAPSQSAATSGAKTKPAAPAASANPRLWSALHSDDLPTLVARLRAAGFPPALIRAIVSSQIEALFAARMKALVGAVSDTPFWKPEPLNSINNAAFYEQYNQIYRDRAKLLRQLLSDNSLTPAGADVTAAQRRQFGDLSRDKIDLVQRINDDYAEMTSQVRAATQGITLPEDRAKLALLEREKHGDLAAVLSPEELADYEMRTSTLTSRLRPALTLMDASEQEFHTIYQTLQPYTDVLYPGAGAGITYITSDVMQQRRDAQQQVADQLKAVLGDARYADYARASSSEFQQLNRLAQSANLPTDAAVTAFNLRTSAAEQSVQIFNAQGQTTDEKRAALTALAEKTTAQLVVTLGPAAGNAYAQSATWLSAIKRGASVTFSPDGNVSSYRSLPPPGYIPPPPRN